MEEFLLSGGPSSSAAVRVVLVHDIKEEEGERQKEVQEAKSDEEREWRRWRSRRESHSTCASDMAMTMRRTRHKLEPQCDQSCKQGTVQQTRTTLATKKRHCKQTSSAVVQSTALTSLQLMFSWVSRCFRFAATLNMSLCLSLCIRVITLLVVNVPTHSLFTCMWIPCRFCGFSHCEDVSFEVLSLHFHHPFSSSTSSNFSFPKKAGQWVTAQVSFKKYRGVFNFVPTVWSLSWRNSDPNFRTFFLRHS